MSEQEILEGNKLIAQFMGYKYIPFDETKPKNSPVGWWKDNRVGIINKIEKNYLCRKHTDLNYYSSWNWLMPVVEKIDDMKDVRVNDITIGVTSTIIYARSKTNSFFKQQNHSGETRIERTYNAVIEFIKWYNLCQKEK